MPSGQVFFVKPGKNRTVKFHYLIAPKVTKKKDPTEKQIAHRSTGVNLRSPFAKRKDSQNLHRRVLARIRKKNLSRKKKENHLFSLV